MNLKARIGIAAHPDLRLRARVESCEFTLQGDATIGIATGPITLEANEVPLRLAIPFHRHRRVVAGTLGPFRLHIHPAEATLRVAEARVAGTLGGADGVGAETHVQGNCRAELDVAAEMPGKILKAAMEGVFEE